MKVLMILLLLSSTTLATDINSGLRLWEHKTEPSFLGLAVKVERTKVTFIVPLDETTEFVQRQRTRIEVTGDVAVIDSVSWTNKILSDPAFFELKTLELSELEEIDQKRIKILKDTTDRNVRMQRASKARYEAAMRMQGEAFAGAQKAYDMMLFHSRR